MINLDSKNSGELHHSTRPFRIVGSFYNKDDFYRESSRFGTIELGNAIFYRAVNFLKPNPLEHDVFHVNIPYQGEKAITISDF